MPDPINIFTAQALHPRFGSCDIMEEEAERLLRAGRAGRLPCLKKKWYGMKDLEGSGTVKSWGN